MGRGYHERLFSNKSLTDFEEFYLISGNYEFPILFPDWSFGSLAFVRTLSANLFYDYSIGTTNGIDMYMRST